MVLVKQQATLDIYRRLLVEVPDDYELSEQMELEFQNIETDLAPWRVSDILEIMPESCDIQILDQEYEYGDIGEVFADSPVARITPDGDLEIYCKDN